jgi:hypothetical protein
MHCMRRKRRLRLKRSCNVCVPVRHGRSGAGPKVRHLGWRVFWLPIDVSTQSLSWR